MKAAMKAEKKDHQAYVRPRWSTTYVPITTLNDRLSGRVEHGLKPGPRSYLERSEETELVSFIV